MKQVKHNFLSGHSIFAQLFALIPSDVFDKVTKDTDSDKYCKKMNSKEHFICLFYAVLTRNSSLTRKMHKKIG